MLVISLLRWWYTDGWLRRAGIVKLQINGVMDYFSIDLLLRTLFAPYRQISAGKVDGSIEVIFRAFIDRLISRLIGAMVRTFLLIFGVLAIIFQSLFGLVVLILWAVVPVLPIVGLALMLIGWTF